LSVVQAVQDVKDQVASSQKGIRVLMFLPLGF